MLLKSDCTFFAPGLTGKEIYEIVTIFLWLILYLAYNVCKAAGAARGFPLSLIFIKRGRAYIKRKIKLQARALPLVMTVQWDWIEHEHCEISRIGLPTVNA